MSLLRTAATRSFAVGRIHGAAPMATFLPLWSRSFSNTTGVYKKDMIKSAPGWDSDLASESEADVKADRDPLPRNVAELQRETIEVIREKDSVANNMKEFDQATNKLEEEVHRVGQEMNLHGKNIMKGMDHMVEEAFDVLKELERFPKNAKNRFEYTEDEVVEDVKDGTQKVGHFMKETLDSVKRTVGLGTEDMTDEMNANKIKKKVKNVDDKVDSDRGA
ncbi:hypothetical protein BG011_001404 [Mortierella polycephala]|uniref:Uncharacterized protein n=1 Tax=Mortierella polycephala TaxID=41804 RepID=A0A9P6Q5E4_9FUNG|nr:hypothetical protein BG011_001404 [Mortierella polycephala]